MVDKNRLKDLPLSSGVYIMKDKHGTIIYVGKAKNLKNRVSQYFLNKQTHTKVASMVQNVDDFEYILTPSELDAFMLESNLIKKHQPFYNILLKDDKAYPYIRIDTTKDFPRVEVARRIGRKGKYFGPYFNGIRVSDLIKIINNNFPLRKCTNFSKNATRECLNYHLGLCSAPCTKRIDKAGYDRIVEDVIKFLKGKYNLEPIIKDKMQKCVEVQNFERALELRDCLKILGKLKERSIDRLTQPIDIDAWGYASDNDSTIAVVSIIRAGRMIGLRHFDISGVDGFGSAFLMQYYMHNPPPDNILLPKTLEDMNVFVSVLESSKKIDIIVPIKGLKKKLVEQSNANALEIISKGNEKDQKIKSALNELKDRLRLKNIPHKIECYDISHISGTDKVASMVVFIDGAKATKYYRKFKIKTVEGNNDFACMNEVISRRIERLGTDDISFGPPPDLIVVDGGKGQLSASEEVILSAGIDVVSLAKREEEVFLPYISTPIILSRNSLALHILQNIRDEAHRFAITFHRSLRGKRQTKSTLDGIEGIGEVKKKALLDRFKTISNIKEASIDELKSVKGINEINALNIYNYFNE